MNRMKVPLHLNQDTSYIQSCFSFTFFLLTFRYVIDMVENGDHDNIFVRFHIEM